MLIGFLFCRCSTLWAESGATFPEALHAEIGSYGEGGWRMDAGEAAELFATPRPLEHYIKDMAQTHVCSLWARSKWEL